MSKLFKIVKEIVLVFRGTAQENRGPPEGFVSVAGWGNSNSSQQGQYNSLWKRKKKTICMFSVQSCISAYANNAHF